MNIFERIKKFDLPIGQYAVFGSALLDVWGIRHAADLDIIATSELFNELRYNPLRNGGWKEIQAHGFTILAKDDANITTTQQKATDRNYCPDRVQLIRNAVFIREIPFVRIEEVIACKKAYNRPKDLADIASIENYIKSHKKDLYKID